MHAKKMAYRCFVHCCQWLLVATLTICGAFLLSFTRVTLPTVQASDVENQSTPVILHPSSQEFPDVDGKRVVWQDARSGPTDIFMYDMDKGETVNVTQSPTWEVQPAIDGNIIVWKDGYKGIGIHGVDLATNTLFTVTAEHKDVSRPHLSGNIVVWADNRAGKDDWNIYGYAIDSATEFVISAEADNQADPQVDGLYVVWWDYQERIYLYNLETKAQQTILATRGARLPDVSAHDNLVIWQDMRNGNWDIYGYDLAQQTEIPLVVAPRDQGHAVVAHGLVAFQSRTEGSAWNIGLLTLIDGQNFILDLQSGAQTQVALADNLVVWQDIRNHTADIYSFTWSGEIPVIGTFAVTAPSYLQAGALPGGAVLLQWEDQADAEEGFVLERAQGITGTQWVEIGQLPANVTTYTDQPTQLDESYWYRVRARRANAYSAYSNESFNTTFTETPNLYELYLMTLINAARADPAAFGYADYPPVPPLAYNPKVAYSAHAHSQAILNSGFQFGHCDPIGRCPTERARAVGYPHLCAENLTTSFRTGPTAIAEANQGFLHSEGHRNNMLAADFTEFGVGHTFDRAKGDSTRHGQVTEVFCGNRAASLPALPTGAIFPYIGSTLTQFTYLVNFYSATGVAPSQAQVIIDGVAHPMTLHSGKASHGTYQLTLPLPAGADHAFYFAFALDANQPARWPATGVIPYPTVFAPAALPGSAIDPPAPTPTFRHLLYLPRVAR